jgi:anhydro-N-acetylmuramic acid kinase
VATATALTATTIADACHRFLPDVPQEVILCGGGAHNTTLIRMLQERLGDVRITTTDSYGIDVDAKEAVSFAILACATIRGLPGNVPAATGASESVILGTIVPGR